MKGFVWCLAGSALAGYKWFERAGVDWYGASHGCKQLGAELVTFESEEEFKTVQALIGESTEAFWIGYRDDHGIVMTAQGQPAQYTTFSEGEPNNKMGAENCIRMRFGLMGDALCEIYWAGPKKQNIGMSYICEGDFPDAPRALPDQTEVDDPDEVITIDVVLYPENIFIQTHPYKKTTMKKTTGLYNIVEEEIVNGRPVYQNTNNPKTYFSYYYDELNMKESDGMWKFSVKNMINKLGGDMFIKDQSNSPDKIDPEAKCFVLRQVGGKKSKDFDEFNCRKDMELHPVNLRGAWDLTSVGAPRRKSDLVNGIYNRDTVDTSRFVKFDGSMYAVQRDGKWEFRSPRTLSSPRPPYLTIESSSENPADWQENNVAAYAGRKTVKISVNTFSNERVRMF